MLSSKISNKFYLFNVSILFLSSLESFPSNNLELVLSISPGMDKITLKIITINLILIMIIIIKLCTLLFPWVWSIKVLNAFYKSSRVKAFLLKMKRIISPSSFAKISLCKLSSIMVKSGNLFWKSVKNPSGPSSSSHLILSSVNDSPAERYPKLNNKNH